MKKKGVLFIILIVILVLAVLVGIFALLFTISSFEVDTQNNLKNVNKNELTAYIEGTYKGKNTVTFSKSEFIADVEKHFPYIEIVNVERVPTAKIKVTVKERMEVFAISHDSKFYKFDVNGFLIKKEDTNTGGDGDYACIELLNLKLENLEELENSIGQIPSSLKSDEQFAYVVEFVETLKRLEYNYTDLQIKGFVSSISLDFENNMQIETRYGTKMLIYDFDKEGEKKTALIMQAYTSGMASLPTQTLIIGNDFITTLKE